MNKPFNWGILATGRIANTFAHALARAQQGKLLAVASRRQESAEKFAAAHHAPRAYGSYQAMLDAPEVDAVYISTPHPMHLEWVVKAAKAGKHIFCEKPSAMNEREARMMIDAVRQNNVAFMEAFVYRCHPVTAKLIELLRAGAIGQVRMIQGNYGFNPPFDPKSRIFDKSLGGGALLDVGCYPVSYARLLAGAVMGDMSAEPIEVHAVGHLGSTDVDEWSSAVMRFPGDIIAQISTTMQALIRNELQIFGSEGNISVAAGDPYHPNYGGGESKIIISRGFRVAAEEVVVRTEKPLFTIAIETFTEHVLRGEKQVAWPGMGWDDTIANMRTIDRWRKCIGLTYEADRKEVKEKK